MTSSPSRTLTLRINATTDLARVWISGTVVLSGQGFEPITFEINDSGDFAPYNRFSDIELTVDGFADWAELLEPLLKLHQIDLFGYGWWCYPDYLAYKDNYLKTLNYVVLDDRPSRDDDLQTHTLPNLLRSLGFKVKIIKDITDDNSYDVYDDWNC